LLPILDSRATTWRDPLLGREANIFTMNARNSIFAKKREDLGQGLSFLSSFADLISN